MENTKKKLSNPQLIIFLSVIAVLCIAILAITVGLTSKVNGAMNEALLDRVNAKLAQCEESEGKNKTMYEALEDVKKAGYLVGEINNSSASKLVWDQDTDRFILVDSQGKLVAGSTSNMNRKVRLWQTYSSMPAEQTFSIYANDDFSPKDNLLITVGFDTGNNQDFKKLTYYVEGADCDVTIRTNDGACCTELVVNSNRSYVNHYGSLECATIVSLGNGAYHEYGEINGIMTVNKGNVQIERGCDVQQLVVSQSATRDTTLEIKAFSNVDTLVVDSSTAVVKGRTNAGIKTIVADWGNSNISVDPRINSAEVVKVHVSSEEELVEAVGSKSKYIVLDDSFEVSSLLEINYNLSLDGNGKTITSSITRGAFLYVSQTETTLFIKDLNYVDANIDNAESYTAFLVIGSGYTNLSDMKLFLFNVDTEGRNECLVVNSNASADVYILAGSDIKANIPLYCIGDYCNVYVSNSTLQSRAIDNYASGAIIMDGYNANVVITNSAIILNTLDKENSSLYGIYITGYARYVDVNLNACSFVFTGSGTEELYYSYSSLIHSVISRDGSVIYRGE